MKLILCHPSPWPVHRLGDGQASAPPDRSIHPSIFIAPVEIASSRWLPWMERVVALERPAFTTAEIARHESTHSTLGWRVERVESQLTAGNELQERRLAYLYFVLEWCGAVVFRASPTQFAAEIERAEAVLASARPEWQDGIVALAQLYET